MKVHIEPSGRKERVESREETVREEEEREKCRGFFKKEEVNYAIYMTEMVSGPRVAYAIKRTNGRSDSLPIMQPEYTELKKESSRI